MDFGIQATWVKASLVVSTRSSARGLGGFDCCVSYTGTFVVGSLVNIVNHIVGGRIVLETLRLPPPAELVTIPAANHFLLGLLI